MSDDLVTWLRAQLHEDERVAREASAEHHGPTWRAEQHGYEEYEWSIVADDEAFVAAVDEAEAQHIGLHDPARVLREVEAKELIVERCVQALADEGIPGEDMQGGLAEDVLSLLALPYADRPGYREKWRP